MNTIILIALLFLTYLLGSIPVGYLLVKYVTGKNILEQGSGNIGSTNVGRVAGKKWSVATQLLDMLKGLLPVALYLLFSEHFKIQSDLLIYFFALAAILGHNFSIFLRFKGGKGVNTTLGAVVLLAPVAVFSSVAVFFVVKWLFKYVSVGSMVMALTMPLVEWIQNGSSTNFYFLLFCFLLILLRHQSNIRRLLSKKELNA